MFLADYHTHSGFSGDGRDDISAMLSVAEQKGLQELCVTDHCDMDLHDFDRDAYWRLLDHAERRNPTGTRLLRGIELGEGFWLKDEAEALLAADPYDFVIGSVHTLRGGHDIYYIRYQSAEQCYRMLDVYWQESIELAEWGNFDVMGHLTYPLRYMCGRDGISLPDITDRYETVLQKLFEILCRKGKGIEVNLSGLYRQGRFGKPMPDLDLLKLYRRCGGEIVTLGSDAHTAKDVGSALKEGREILQKAGFSYVTAYKARIPRMEPM